MLRQRLRFSRVLPGFAALALCAATARSQPAMAPDRGDVLSRIDGVFAKWNSATLPGCTVGVSRDGMEPMTRAYGMADLEHGIANKPDSIIESGSLSKQFTAAAVLLLVQQGKVSLEDPVRKYIPELPDYAAPLSVRHILTHTSGLRDWGSIESIVGWPRTTRVYTHAHVLDIVSRQKALNFPPGSAYSYSNTGYNLAAVLVSRVSGKSFSDFSRENLFEPLGMTRTSWRDDFTRVVKDRSIAYDVSPSGVVTMDMPFENVHGNGGLLTTVGDLLRWNENATSSKVGGRSLIELQRQPMKLTDGSSIEYAFGLRVSSWNGVPEISHSGSTAGYRAWLAQYPTKNNLSVAVLCNAANAPPVALGHQVGDLFLGTAMAPAPQPLTLLDAELKPLVGLYRGRRRPDVLSVEFGPGPLRIGGLGPLFALSRDSFRIGAGPAHLDVERGSTGDVRGFRVTSAGEVTGFDRVERSQPDEATLSAYAGVYTSDEAELTLRVTVKDGELLIHRRPDTTLKLAPTYADAFSSSLGGVRFIRNAKGVVREMSITQERVWDLRFARTH